MKKGMLKKSIAVMMAATMLFSMTGCGKDGGGTKKKSEETQNTKEMVFEGEDFPLTGYQGDIGSVYVKNDKIYFDTYEWIEEGSENQEDTSDGVTKDKEDTSDDEAEDKEDASGEETEDKEDTSDEETEDKEDASDDEAEDKEDTADETTEDKDDASDDTTEDQEDASDVGDEEGFEEMKGTSVSRLYSADIDGSNVTEIPLSSMEENQWMNSLTIGSDGTIAFLLSTYDEKTEKGTYELVKIDEQGKELFRIDITKELKLTQEDYVSRMLIDGKGRIIVTTDQRVCILDENGKSIGEVKSENYLEGAAVTKDGTVICASGVYTEDESYAQVQVLDVDGKKWGDSYKLDISYFPSSDSLMDGIEYDFYYKDESGIYGYDMAGKKADKIIDYVASNITSDNTWGIIPIGKDKLLGKSYEETGTKVILYSKVDPATIEDKITITYGGVWIDDDVKKAAIEFNKTSKDYRIEFKDYSNEEDPQTKLNADIAAGNVPDIMELGSISVEQYIAKGMLEDLTPYYDKDSEIGTEDILDSALEAMKVDNKLYYVTPSFGVSTMIARKSDVGDGTGWTFDELKALLETKDDDVKLCWSDNKSDMLNSLLNISDFIDWQTGECRFDSQDFKDVLEICNDRGVNEEQEYDEDAPSTPTLIKEGKLLLLQGWVSPEEVEVYDKMFDGDFTYIGYPNEEKQGSYFDFDSKVGIYSKSEVKDAAWEFIRTFMTKEYQGSARRYNTPTRKDCFDMMIKRVTATEAYTDELGQEIEPLESSWGWDGLDVEIKPLTDEQADLYINLVNNTKKTSNYNEALTEIIQDEVKAYFAGEKSLDETADIIQNRIKTYVNENR